MSDTDEQRELDDELISAYVDDELSVAERAAVERRLAADPAAQRLFHELRLVSQSVQGMPQENMGRDLSATIVGLIEQERKPTPVPADGSRFGGNLPKLPIFGSARAWIWASLALAAGLLIMVVERGDEQGNKLAPVAQHRAPGAQIAANKPALQPSAGANREAEVALDRVAAPPPASAVAENGRPTKESPMSASGEISSVRQSGAPSGAAGLAASAPKAADSKPVSELSGSGRGMGGPRPTISSSQPAQGQVAKSDNDSRFGGLGGGQAEFKSQEPLLVRVVVTPDAIQNKSFERLLASNGIAVETDQKHERSRQMVERRLKSLAEKQPAAASTPVKKSEAKQPELLVVDATSGAIDACLKTLHDDTANYVSVNIEKSSAANDQSKDKSQLHDSELDSFGQYARGSRKPDANDGVEMRREFYDYNKEVSTRQLGDEVAKSDAFAPNQEAKTSSGAAAPQRKSEAAASSGWAVRLPANESIATSAGAKPAAGRDFGAANAPKRSTADEPYGLGLSATQKSDPGKMRVVFLLIPEDRWTPSQSPGDAAK